MNAWKVILATLVIYSAGLVTGSLLVRYGQPQRRSPIPNPEPSPATQPWFLQHRFLERMRHELNLTPEQVARLDRIFADGRERTRIIVDAVQPEMQAELRSTRERIIAELMPPQRRRFEELLRSRPNRPEVPRPQPRDGREPRYPPPPGPSNFAPRPE